LFLSGPAYGGHQVTGIEEKCSVCHSTDLLINHSLPICMDATFGEGDDFCWRCHVNNRTEVQNTIANGIAGQDIICSDCHGAGSLDHINKHILYMLNFTQFDGVNPGTAPRWQQITSFTTMTTVDKQYQRCFKCHSYNKLGPLQDGHSDIITKSGVPLSDLAMEFNPNNRSAHPVMVPLNQQAGSYEPRRLTDASDLIPQWQNVGNQTMMCTDCHMTKDMGPQGANYKFLLKGPNRYWPESSEGRLFSLDDFAGDCGSRPCNTNPESELFCLNCHNVYQGNKFSSRHHRLHSASGRFMELSDGPHPVYCVGCHTVVPHGSDKSRLIAYNSDPFPRTWRLNGSDVVNQLEGFEKAASQNQYSQDNCFSTNAGCAVRHLDSVGNYE
jgi:hypothetical protein